MNLKRLFSTVSLVLLVFFLIDDCFPQSVNLRSLLEEMADRHHLSYFPEPQYELKQFSSYNRRSKNRDSSGWFANYDMSHFLRVENNNDRREFVMFDTEGPGSIVRWWMTFYKAQNGIIRVYLDHNTQPVIVGSPADVLSGEMLTQYPFSASVHEGAPLGEEGRDYDHNFYLPIPYSKHCKITYECDSLILKYNYGPIKVEEGYYWPDVFYNINYRKYLPGTKVESFTKEILEEAKPLLNRVGKILLDQPILPDTVSYIERTIHPGDSLKIEIASEYSAVDRLALDLRAEDIKQALRSVVLAVTFDGIQTVWVPVGEFFGVGYMPVSHKTWINKQQEDGRMESRWVMPFRENCQITFVNFGTEEVSLQGSLGITRYKWKPNSLYFGASWHEYRHIKTRDENGSKFDLNFINIQGKGIYVGDQITLFNNTWHWWGEGDEKIFVDGETFPSHFGTGSEDYYGYAFGRPEPFSHPFLSQPVGTGNTNWGVTVNMRHRSLDALPFTKSINVNMELWHWASITMNYAVTTYWYVEHPYLINIEPDVEAVQYPVAKSKGDLVEQ
jgi:hypothetical protein